MASVQTEDQRRFVMRPYIAAVLVVGVAFAILGPAQASAQQVSSFEQLQLLVRPGDTIVVVGTDGKSAKGKIESLSATSLRLAAKGSIREFTQTDAVEIKQRRGDSLANGAWIGAAIGGAPLGVAAAISCRGDCRFVAAAVAIYTGIGAAIGVGVDAMITHNQTIYRPPVRAALSRIRVAPLLAGDRKGVAINVSF